MGDFDKDGYPSEGVLQELTNWDPLKGRELLERARGLWHWPNYYAWVEGDTWHFATGGWSGNESIIAALQENRVFWGISWVSSDRGGKHVFEWKLE